MVPATRKLQKIVVPPTDYIGFDVLGCTEKKLRRLQAKKPQDKVQKYSECANLSLWYMNNTLMNNSHNLHINPALITILERVTDAVGNVSAKIEFAKLKSDVIQKRRLQAKKPKNWQFAFNSNQTGALLVNLTPYNVESLE